jgi:hypothetical protein
MIGAFLLAFSLGRNYIQAVFQLGNNKIGWRYMLASVFGLKYPIIEIGKTAKKQNSNRNDWIEKIGGPAILVIQPGFVVLIECADGDIQVLSAGRHLLNNFDRLKEIVTLEEQSYCLERISAFSKDCIEVEVKNSHFRYSIKRSSEPTPTDPYPSDEVDIKNQVYNRTLTDDGVATWLTGIKFTVEGVILDYINEHTLDALTAPGSMLNERQKRNDPRSEIHERMKRTERDLKSRGTQLTWFDLGSFSTPADEITKQRIETWRTKWMGESSLVRLEGETQIEDYKNLGRAEGQAEILRSITNALADINMSGDSRMNIRKIFLIRTAQVIESLIDQLKK